LLGSSQRANELAEYRSLGNSTDTHTSEELSFLLVRAEGLKRDEVQSLVHHHHHHHHHIHIHQVLGQAVCYDVTPSF
jgi:hypothetical protein